MTRLPQIVTPGSVVVAFLFATMLFAATAPEQINYQAKVEMQGVPFDGVGQFKFAIVDQAGTNTYWSNDGTSVGGNEPTDAVSLNVKGGLLNVMLGNEAHPNMTTVSAFVFSYPDTWFRVWFGGKTGSSFERLTPDTRMASVPYAMISETVPDDSLSGYKLMRESVWPVHAGRNNTIVSYYAEYHLDTVTVGTIASNKNFIITDISYSSIDPDTSWRHSQTEIRYTTNAVDTVLFKACTGNGNASFPQDRNPVVTTFRSGLVVPAGAELKIGGFRDAWPLQCCTVSGFEIPVE